jgi:hypothetical protein
MGGNFFSALKPTENLSTSLRALRSVSCIVWFNTKIYVRGINKVGNASSAQHFWRFLSVIVLKKEMLKFRPKKKKKRQYVDTYSKNSPITATPLTTHRHRYIASGEIYNRYISNADTGNFTIDYARCSALSSASALISQRT